MGDRALTLVVLDVSELPDDLATVEHLARLQLEMRRDDRRLVLVGCSRELRRLIELAGLSEVLDGLLDPARLGRIAPWPSSST